MAEIEVPDFKSSDDFKNWVKSLDEKEIQKWSTDDWLKMYEKVDKYVDSEDFSKELLEKAPGLCKDGRFGNWTYGEICVAVSEKNIDDCRFAFTEMCADEFGIMYRNYRFEPEQLQCIRKHARENGEKMAKRKDIDAARLAISSAGYENDAWYLRDDEIKKVTRTASNITQYSTSYGGTAEKGHVSTEIFIDKNMLSRGVTIQTGNGSGEIRVNSQQITDQSIHVAFHESAHAYLQVGNEAQKSALKTYNLYAYPELGENFYLLMDKNGQYYLSPKSAMFTVNKYYQELCSGGYLNDSYYKLWDTSFRRACNGYHKQPTERYSNIYGIEAERAFRRATGQVSERTADKVADFIEGRTDKDIPVPSKWNSVGRPHDVRYTANGVVLVYNTNDKLALEELEGKIKKRFVGADESLLKDLNIISDKTFGQVKVTVPTTWEFSKKWNSFSLRAVPLAMQQTTELVQTSVAVQTPKEGETAVKGVTNNVTNGAEEAAIRLEEKATEKLGTAATGTGEKVASKTTAKKSGVLAKAAAANAKFDRAVDKVIDKGAKKLNNSKVGQAYHKATEKVSNTKAGKAVGKATETVAKKVAETTAGKAVGKVVAKTVGTAVGKSVLKKIPLVSAGAGAYFAYERIKNGEWKAAGCEFLSGVAGCFPGIGTGISVAIDGGLAANDIHNAVKGAKTKNQSKATAVKPKAKYVAKAQPKSTQKPKKTIQKTNVSTEQLLKQKQNSRA